MNINTDVLEHHGIKGQKWGDRNGPPYPLNDKERAAVDKRAEKIRDRFIRGKSASDVSRTAFKTDRKVSKLKAKGKYQGETDLQIRGRANLRRANAHGGVAAYLLNGTGLGLPTSIYRTIANSRFINGLPKEERGALLDQVGKMNRPMYAKSLVNNYRRLYSKTKKWPQKERLKYFNKVLKEIESTTQL